MYNSSILSLYTPDTLPISPGTKDRLDADVALGRNIARNSTVVIAALLRDKEGRLPEIEKKVEKIGKTFADYRFVIVENDSSDDTRKHLLSWAKRNPRIEVLGCGINTPECHMKFPKTDGHGVDTKRISKMVTLRNIYLDHIKRYYPHFDYTFIWDLDAISMVYIDGIWSSLAYMSRNSDVDLVCSYGIYRWGFLTLFYDTYAYLDIGEPFHISHKLLHDIKKGLGVKHLRGEEPIEVDSCFSGFAIYRTQSLCMDGVVYDMTPARENNIECEHVRLNKKLKGRKVMNPSMVHFLLLND